MDSSSPVDALIRTLRARGIRDERVLGSIAAVPRELFLPEHEQAYAYDDTALSIDCRQTISQPYVVALMTESLRLHGDERLLEIGTGSGYQSAILSRLCREVVTIERHESLLRAASNVHATLGCRNVVYRLGDGTLGCPELAPFDGILVTAAAPEIPMPLYEQLRPGGRMIVPVGSVSEQELLCVSRDGEAPGIETLCACRFVPLIGAAGWPDEPEAS